MKENVDRTTIIRKLMEKGIAESKKERAAQLYIEGKTYRRRGGAV